MAFLKKSVSDNNKKLLYKIKNPNKKFGFFGGAKRNDIELFLR